jgi:hypothetical protein
MGAAAYYRNGAMTPALSLPTLTQGALAATG